MLRIARDQYTYRLAADVAPVATVAPGSRVTLETYDASTGRIRQPEDLLTYLQIRDPLKVNPATGPVCVDGARPGDALAVEILAIRLEPPGFVRASAGGGLLQAGLDLPGVLMVDVADGALLVGGRWRLPARPMVGVIGTAPATGVTYTAHPGPTGGNLDINAVTVGARVYLPVEVPGGLLAIGDIHAAMGDGEVSGTGVEICGQVTVQVDLVPGAAPPRPWLETAGHWIATGSAPNLEDAAEIAVDGLCRLVAERLGATRTEAFMLVSAFGDVRIGQCARLPNLDRTAYAVFPRAAAAAR